MIIAGAGGHAMELLDLLIEEGFEDEFYFFDELTDKKIFQGRYPIISTEDEVKVKFQKDQRFMLGTGNPKLRSQFYIRFLGLGGKHLSIHSSKSQISPFAACEGVDVFSRCFVGPNTQIGKGTLLNTGCQIHHEVILGEFVEVSPGALLLGGAEIGDYSLIGSNATILPKIRTGKKSKIGAGTVVTKDVPDRVTIIGIQGRAL